MKQKVEVSQLFPFGIKHLQDVAPGVKDQQVGFEWAVHRYLKKWMIPQRHSDHPEAMSGVASTLTK